MILRMMPCLDSEEMAGARRRELDIRLDVAKELGQSDVSAADNSRRFRQALKNDFRGAFSDIVFAITDWSPERRFLELSEMFSLDA